MDINEIIIPIIGVVLPLGIGFVFGKWDTFRKAAKESANPFDDKLVDAVERLAEKIVKAKQEDPNTPLGE